MSIAHDIVEKATELSTTITTVESCTGGLVSAAITDIAGSSAVFERGFVTYSNTAKMELVQVSQQVLDDFGAVSENTVKDMATGGLKAAHADIAIAVSGIAGPGGSDHKPEGRVCFACATRSGVISETVEFGAIGRANVRAKAVQHALSMVWNALNSVSD